MCIYSVLCCTTDDPQKQSQINRFYWFELEVVTKNNIFHYSVNNLCMRTKNKLRIECSVNITWLQKANKTANISCHYNITDWLDFLQMMFWLWTVGYGLDLKFQPLAEPHSWILYVRITCLHTADICKVTDLDDFLFVFLTVVALIQIRLLTKTHLYSRLMSLEPVYLELLLESDLYISDVLCWEEDVLAQRFGWCPLMRSILSAQHHPYSNQCLIEQGDVVWGLTLGIVYRGSVSNLWSEVL